MPESEGSYMDSEKAMFDRESSGEQERRINEAGTLETAIQQYGLEKALQSMDSPYEDLTPEDQERFDKMVGGARNIIDAFGIRRSPDGKKGENLIIVTDDGADELLVRALYQAGREKAGADSRVMVSGKPTGPAQPFGKDMNETIAHADCLLLVTSFSRSHSQGMVELINTHPNEMIARIRAIRQAQRGSDFPTDVRAISITQTRPEILTEGAALEKLGPMRERLTRLQTEMSDVGSVHVVSDQGTDLELDIKEGRTFSDDGRLDKPGKMGNFPFGEWSTGVDLEATNGTLVIDGVSTSPVGELDQPITLEIQNGVVVNIRGGEAAKRLKDALDEADRTWREKHPEDTTTSAYRVAELGIGVNSQAFRYTPDGRKIAPPTSLEGEKGLGTIHIALGKNTLFGVSKDDPDYNPIAVHIDNIIMQPTLVGRKKDNSRVTLIEKGEARF